MIEVSCLLVVFIYALGVLQGYAISGWLKMTNDTQNALDVLDVLEAKDND